MFDAIVPQDYPPPPPPQSGPRPSLLPFLADHHLPYIVPAIVYWVISLAFHYIDTRNLLSVYKIHVPAEHLTKNRASKRDVIRFALFQQAAQCILGYLMADRGEQFVPHEYAIAEWAQKIRHVEHSATEWMLYFVYGLTWITNKPSVYGAASAAAFPQNPYNSHVGNFSQITLTRSALSTAPFSVWNTIAAKTIYWVIVPLLQYVCAMVLADTFQYFTHRAFHVNKWLYKHIHSMHHDIYVPFAYGAFYNHPLETIPIDGIGFPFCLSIAKLDNRQAAFFGAIWTFKTVVDHCGYDFPYNPCNIVCRNSVLFHDLHHQTWGMKYNFSVYGSFWDWLMGTHWSPYDEKAQDRYRKSKAAAEAKSGKGGSGSKTVDVATGNSKSVEL